MNLAIISFKNIDCEQSISDLIEAFPIQTVFLPIVKSMPTFYESVIRAVKKEENKDIKLKCFFLTADGNDSYLKYADDLVVTDNPIKEVLRNLTPEDAIGITWDDSPQSHFIIHSVEDLAMEVWDISDDLEPININDFGFSGTTDDLHDELMEAMGHFVDLLATFVASTVMDSLSQAVAEHLILSEEEGRKGFNPFKEEE